MNAQQIVALASRIFAIWLFTYTIRLVATALGSGPQFAGLTAAVSYLMAFGLAILALLVWLFPLAIANKVLPRTQYTNVVRMHSRQVAGLATAILGLWFMIDAISSIAAVIQYAEQPSFQFTPRELIYILIAFGPMAIGGYLLKKPFAVADRILPAHEAANVSHVVE